jgi:CheY-like chemotaxis protein
VCYIAKNVEGNNWPILIAEDNPQDVDLMKLALPRAGLNGPIRFVGDGREAVDYLEGKGDYGNRAENPFPRVIISDLKMPNVDGLELLRWLRSHPQCRIIPAILLSASALQADVSEAYRLGANTYFQKPGSFQELVNLLRELKEYWQRSELPQSLDSC